ncbi:protein DMP2-like [Typha latifolia]|uniref:protein DMP2-like n=1 Tax=Typha latifolia TaxID=4733 RepID=UPI003C2E4243
MASSSPSIVIQIPQGQEQELKELERTPLNQSPLRSTPAPPKTPPSVPAATPPPVLDRTLASVANLVKLLPTGTVLAFQSLSPSFTDHGKCYPSDRYMSALLVFFCAFFCIFLSFTDSLLGSNGKPYYGLATFKGFYVFNYHGADEDRGVVFGDLTRLRIRFLDYVHAFFGALVFLVVAFSDSGIQNCFFPDSGPNTKELLVNLPLGAGFLSSVVFMIFPTSRKGIGYSDTTPHSK